MRNTKIRVGIVGLGIVSAAHELGYQHTADRAEIVAVCDLDETFARQRAEPYKARVYQDYRELLRDPRVEAVDIILPHNLHFRVASDAIQQGKHVIVEKPLALTSGQAMELCATARAKSIKFTVAENTRFVAAYVEAEKLLRAGTLGDLRQIRTSISGSEVYRLRVAANWKGRKEGSGGGAIVDAGPHSFYLLKWLVGEIQDLQAFQARLVDESEVEDNAVVVGHLKNGGIFETEFSFTVEAPWNERVEIYGSEASLIVDQLCDPPARLFRGGKDYQGTALPNVPYDPVDWKRRSITAGVVDFVQAIWDDRPPTVDPNDGCYVMQVVEKAYESVALGNLVRV